MKFVDYYCVSYICVPFYRDGIVLFRAKNLLNKFEDNTVKYTGGASKADIDSWITKN